MKKQISSIAIHQTSKILAILYFVITAIFCIPLGFLALLGGNSQGAIFFFLIPIFYLIGSYIITAIGSWLYNKIADYFGGIEVTVKEVSKENT